MTNATINIDPSANLAITGIYTGHSFEFVFKNYTDKTKSTPENFTGVYSIIVWEDSTKTRKLFTIHEGVNLVKSGNTLTFKMGKTSNKFRHEGTYYYQIIDDVDTEKSFPVIKGTIHVNTSR